MGISEVPAGNMHGGVWLRVLRMLLAELSLPTTFISSQSRRLIEPFLKKLNLSFRHRLFNWRPFEDYNQEQQYLLMHVASLVFEDAFKNQSSLPTAFVSRFAPMPIPDRGCIENASETAVGYFFLQTFR